MLKTVLKNILKGTVALTLSFVISLSNTFASDMPDEEKQIIAAQSSNADDLQLALPVNHSTLFSLPGKLFGVQEELALYNKSQYAAQFLNSEDFKNALNNLLTWAAYNESKRLYIQHGDKFIAPLADALVDANFALAKNLVLKITGLNDVVKAVGILTGDTFSPQKKPSAYIRENHSQSFMDICRLKFLTDTLNEKIIGPHVVGPCVAYAVHKADVAGAIQQHIVTQILDFLEQQKPALERKANMRLEQLELEIAQAHKKFEILGEKIADWAALPEALEIQKSLNQNANELQEAQKQQSAQQKIVDDECAQMSTVTYYVNYLPFTSTQSQMELKARAANVNQLLSKRSILENAYKQIKKNLEYQNRFCEGELQNLEKEKDQIHKGLNGEDIRSRTVSLTKAFASGFIIEDEEDLSEKSPMLENAFAGMSWVEMMQPCPHLNYRYLQWMGSQGVQLHEGEPIHSNQEPNPYVQYFINKAAQAGMSYLEVTGVTKSASDLQCNLSQETLTQKANKIFEIYEKTKKDSEQKDQVRTKILEDSGICSSQKTKILGGSYMGQLKSIASNYFNITGIVAGHAYLVKENVTLLGKDLRTAARPITVAVQALKYTAPVWAVSTMTSYVLDVSMPYGTGLIVPLALGVMDDFGLWEPTLEYAAETKNAFVSRFTKS